MKSNVLVVGPTMQWKSDGVKQQNELHTYTDDASKKRV